MAQFTDRPYQTQAVEAVWDYFRNGGTGNPLIAMPTGTGKSVVIARFLQSVYRAYPNQRTLVLTHVKELIAQNYHKLQVLWDFAPAGIYSAGLGKKDTNCPITFAGIASIKTKANLFGHIDLILIDEAHLLSPNDTTMYQTFISALKKINPAVKVIGLTATPWRLGHGHLTDPLVDRDGNETPALFTDVCFDLTTMAEFNKLLDDGYLVPLVPRPTKVEFDTQGLHMRGGEFIESEMQQRFDKEEITEEALKEAMAIAQELGLKKWLVFASGTEHADNVGDMLTMLGVPNAVVHSKREGRDKSIKSFLAGEITALVNNNVLTTGFDDPTIDLIIVLRATASSVLWVQMLGRGTRPYYVGEHDLSTREGRFSAIAESGKLCCVVLDYARNTARLGPVNDPVVPKRKGGGGGDAPIKQCEVCDNFNHISARFCGGYPYKTPLGCGTEFLFEVKIDTTAASDQLIKFDEPVVKVLKVDHISFDKHEKEGVPPMVKVTYYCGVKSYSDYVCIEHANFAGRKARQWWKARTDLPFPESTEAALAMFNQLMPTTHLRIWANKKPYPEIMGYCYDGTAFGTIESDFLDKPSVGSDYENRQRGWGGTPSDVMDDDIPF